MRQILWRSLLESLHVCTTQIRNKWDCWKSGAQRKGRHLCCIVASRSEWKSVGRFFGMLHLSTKRHRSTFWWEDTLWKMFWQPFKGPIIPFGSLVEYYFITAKDQSRIHQFGKKVLPGLFFGHALYVGEFGRVTYWSKTLRSWRRWTHRKSTRKDSMRKRWYFPKRGEFIFPIGDGWIKTLGGDQDLRTSTLIRQRPLRGESHFDFLGESEGFLPPSHDSDAGEAINHFWSMLGNFIFRHHVEPRVKLYSPREESFPIPLKYIDVSRTTHTNLDVKQENAPMIIGMSMVERLVGSLDRFHTIYSIGRKSSRRKNAVRGEIDKKTVHIQARSFMARALEVNGKAC